MKITESRIKEIIKEEMEIMEMELDPMTLMLGAGGIYALYQMFFGSEPSDNEQALEAVRLRIGEMEAEADIGMGKYRKPPAQGDFQKAKMASRSSKVKRRIAQRKKDLNI